MLKEITICVLVFAILVVIVGAVCVFTCPAQAIPPL
jgi:hypothetical protein